MSYPYPQPGQQPQQQQFQQQQPQQYIGNQFPATMSPEQRMAVMQQQYPHLFQQGFHKPHSKPNNHNNSKQLHI